MKLNEVFEFIGVLTSDLDHQVDKGEYDDFENGFREDDALVHLPNNKVLLHLSVLNSFGFI